MPHHTSDRLIVALIAALIATCAALWAVTPEPAPAVSPLIQRALEMGYFPCAHEDAVGPCYWNAQFQGNGQGRSFVVTDDNEVFYE